MHAPIQGGFVLEQAKPDSRNFYKVKIEAGGVVTALLARETSGQAVRLKAGDQVVVAFVNGAWVIIKLIPEYFDNTDTAPRLESLAPGDVFLGNAVTGSGMHVTGGVVALEAGGVDGSGKARRAAGMYLVPDADALRAICRRFEIDASTGTLQMLHDDDTNNSAFRLWVRQSAEPGFDGRVARIHMGYHRAPADTVFSLYIFPPGPDPLTGVLDFNFKFDPAQEKTPFAGQWPKKERDDWRTRFYIKGDGGAVFETANVPAPSIVATTDAQVQSRVTMNNDGTISIESLNDVSLDAINAMMQLKKNYTAVIKGDTNVSVKGSFALECDDVTIGDLEKAIPISNRKLYDYIVGKLVPWLRRHTHIDSKGGATTPPVSHVPNPPTEEEAITQNVVMS